MLPVIKITNTLSRKKEIFTTLNPGEVKFYSCGPTTYDFLHVGNGRAAVAADFIYRVLSAFGYKVTFVRNYTDVDDKIIEAANKKGISAKEHAEEFVKECQKDYELLGMLPPTHTPKVTETMDEIIEMIQILISKGHAYVDQGEVLYSIETKNDYLKLSKKNLDDLIHGIRVQVDGHKRHPSDFVLWKPAKEGEPSWPSPWGHGRPGWHIECSAMAKKFLGPQIDLHHGGVDLIFPHHENEIAQSEGANSCEFCKTWAHNEFLNMGSEKMSKSLGNIVTIRGFCQTFNGEILRQLFLNAHYRSVMSWSDEVIERAMGDVERLYQFKKDFLEIKKQTSSTPAEVLNHYQALGIKIKDELANDFNAPGALGNLFSLIRDLRRDYILKGEMPADLYSLVENLLGFCQSAFGLWQRDSTQVLEDLKRIKRDFSSKRSSVILNEETILEKIEQRKKAKASKNWALADQIRNELKEKGILLKDNPDGSTNFSYE